MPGQPAPPSTEGIRIPAHCPLPGARWTPHAGQETIDLLTHLVRQHQLPDNASAERVCHEALNVLSLCLPPTAASGTETGLVIGYVQSGKTMSFITAAALARDNGYRMVIVITGISVLLLDQSDGRVASYLRLSQRTDHAWKYYTNPRANEDLRSIQSALDEWNDPTVPAAARKTVLITVMKNHIHLDHLHELLSALCLDGAPVLIVDDEADQAGLNTAVTQGQESTTYRRLVALRRCIPHHTLLQYTATPQAPLLINLIDILSPRFAVLLTPGAAYTGGRQFFVESPGLIETIPPGDIPAGRRRLTQPPRSLLHAMRLFYLGVAAVYCTQEGAPSGNRSMMVHPSHRTARHDDYHHWVTLAQNDWARVLSAQLDDPDRAELTTEFHAAYQDLLATVHDLPPFEDLLTHLPRAVRTTQIVEVNAARGSTPSIPWRNDYAFILVGGQAMDRGFTVKGLTVTYMPRGAGVGNADTIQQRARFYGYKASYLGYCRVFLSTPSVAVYRSYVDHEEDVRRRLARHSRTGRSLSEWKRAFFLEGNLRPTRQSVLDLDYMRGTYSNAWYMPKAPHDSDEAVETNRQVVSAFLETLQLHTDEGRPQRGRYQVHAVAHGVSLQTALEQLLLPWRPTYPADSQHLTGLMLQVKNYLDDHPDALCSVFHMSQGLQRARTPLPNGEIRNVHQGPLPGHPDIYPGDAAIHHPEQLTIQIHNLRVDSAGGPQENVPALTIWVPACMARTWLTQPQGQVM